MNHTLKYRVAFVSWSVLATLLGSVLMSYHQPFLAPQDSVLSLAGPSDGIHWRAIHFLSGSCGCSQRVMEHLLQRGTLHDVTEQVMVIDGTESYLPRSRLLLQKLITDGTVTNYEVTYHGRVNTYGFCFF